VQFNKSINDIFNRHRRRSHTTEQAIKLIK